MTEEEWEAKMESLKPWRKIKTNADRIRAMDDGELAEWLDSVSKSWYDEGFTKDDETPLMSAYPATASQWIDWLQSPVVDIVD